MKFLYTVGTTPFHSLTRHIISLYDHPSNNIFMQTATTVETKFIKTIDYTDNFSSILSSYEVVVTHAGAGSIYSLLEMGKKIIVVPNTERVDPHQIEISKYIENNKYGLVCWDINNLESCLIECVHLNFTTYDKCAFFKFNEIKGLLK